MALLERYCEAGGAGPGGLGSLCWDSVLHYDNVGVFAGRIVIACMHSLCVLVRFRAGCAWADRVPVRTRVGGLMWVWADWVEEIA